MSTALHVHMRIWTRLYGIASEKLLMMQKFMCFFYTWYMNLKEFDKLLQTCSRLTFNIIFY